MKSVTQVAPRIRLVAVTAMVGLVACACDSSRSEDTSGPEVRPTSSPSGPPAPGFPGPDNTGVPDPDRLTPYDGDCTITEPMTLFAVDATACDGIFVYAEGVEIIESLVPRVETVDDGAVTIVDSTVAAGAWSEGAVWGSHLTVLRSEVTGGQHSVHCNDYCEITDSWLHDQFNPDGEGYHNNAFITNGGAHQVVRHNTLHCTALSNSTGGGCTADVSLFGDFAVVDDVLIEGNLLKANDKSISYCAYGGHSPSKPFPVATAIRFVDNVFERGANGKCGGYGPSTSFQRSAPGNLWQGNVWDDGTVVPPNG